MTTETTIATPAQLPAPVRAALALKSVKAEADLNALVVASKGITEITNDDGRTECHTAAMKARAARVNIEKIAEDARDDATAFSKAVIAEEKRLVAIIKPEQDRLLKLRDEWDEKIAAEKEAKRKAEEERVATLVRRIDAIRAVPVMNAGRSSHELRAALNLVEQIPIGEDFAEMAGAASCARTDVVSKLKDMIESAEQAETEAARIAEEKRLADEAAERLRIEQAAEAERLRLERAELDRQQKMIAEQQEQIRREAERLAEIDREQKRAKAEEEARAAAKVKAEQDTQSLTDEVRELLARKRQRTEAAFMEECRMLELARQKFRADSMNSSPLLMATEPAPQEEKAVETTGNGRQTPAVAGLSVYGQLIDLLDDFTATELLQVLRIAEQIKLDREMAA